MKNLSDGRENRGGTPCRSCVHSDTCPRDASAGDECAVVGCVLRYLPKWTRQNVGKSLMGWLGWRKEAPALLERVVEVHANPTTDGGILWPSCSRLPVVPCPTDNTGLAGGVTELGLAGIRQWPSLGARAPGRITTDYRSVVAPQ